ncbi:MAG: hypothetical protein ACK4VI_04390 [Alphaproteobacteria bacterium]
MTKSEIGFIISRTLALLFLYRALNWLVLSSSYFFVSESYGNQAASIIAYNLLSLAFYVLFAALFWFGSARIGNLIAGTDKNQPNTSSYFDADSLMVFIFIAFGCYLLTYIVPLMSDLISHLLRDITDTTAVVSYGLTEKWIRLLLFSALSLLFIFGAKGLKNFIFTRRELGRKTQ